MDDTANKKSKNDIKLVKKKKNFNGGLGRNLYRALIHGILSYIAISVILILNLANPNVGSWTPSN